MLSGGRPDWRERFRFARRGTGPHGATKPNPFAKKSPGGNARARYDNPLAHGVQAVKTDCHAFARCWRSPCASRWVGETIIKASIICSIYPARRRLRLASSAMQANWTEHPKTKRDHARIDLGFFGSFISRGIWPRRASPESTFVRVVLRERPFASARSGDVRRPLIDAFQMLLAPRGGLSHC